MSEAVTGNAKLFARIAELEAELEGATKVVEILTKLGSHDVDAAKWIAEARELLSQMQGPNIHYKWLERRDALLE